MLMSFGIPVDDLPVTVPTISAKNKYHLQWLKSRANFERLMAESNLVMPQPSSTPGSGIEMKNSDGRLQPSTAHPYQGVDSFQQKHVPKSATMSARSSSSSHVVSANNTYPIHAIVDCPGILHVLFYNGGKAWPHEGNMSFVNLLEKALPFYNETTQGETNKETTERKRSVIRHIIRTVEGPPWNGRFLSWQENEGWWIDMIAANPTPTHMATSSMSSRTTSALSPLEVKVRRAILDHNRRLAASRKRQESSSSTMKFASLDGGSGSNKQRKRILDNCSNNGYKSIDQESDGSSSCCNVGSCQKKVSLGSPASAPGDSPTN
jgi:hypothetical protein